MSDGGINETSDPLKIVVSPTTTAEENRKTAGQRDINLMWETTQRDLANLVTRVAVVVASLVAIFGHWIGAPELQFAAIGYLFGASNNVHGFYFGRTNHTRSGGVGGETAGHR